MLSLVVQADLKVLLNFMADDYADDIVVSTYPVPIPIPIPISISILISIPIPIIVSDSVCGKNAKIIHVCNGPTAATQSRQSQSAMQHKK